MVETRPSDLSNKYDKNENITWKYCLIIDYFLPSDRWSDKNSWIEVGQLFPLKGKGVWNKWIFTIHMYLLSRKRQYSCPRQQTCHYFTILILYCTLFSFLQLVYFELSVSLLWFQIHCNLPTKAMFGGSPLIYFAWTWKALRQQSHLISRYPSSLS